MAFLKRAKTSSETVAPVRKTEGKTVALSVPLLPLVSEKSSRLQSMGQYTFAVPIGVSKVTVKKAIEAAFGVRVIGVNSTRLPRKTVRRGRTVGHTRIRRHVVVRLAPGQSLELTKSV